MTYPHRWEHTQCSGSSVIVLRSMKTENVKSYPKRYVTKLISITKFTNQFVPLFFVSLLWNKLPPSLQSDRSLNTSCPCTHVQTFHLPTPRSTSGCDLPSAHLCCAILLTVTTPSSLQDNMNKLLTTHPNSLFLISGDFNCHHTNWLGVGISLSHQPWHFMKGLL